MDLKVFIAARETICAAKWQVKSNMEWSDGNKKVERSEKSWLCGLRWQTCGLLFHPIGQLHGRFFERMRESQRALLQEQFISLWHVIVLQYKNGNPTIL